MVECEALDREGMFNLVYGDNLDPILPVKQEPGKVSVFEGFHYFSPGHLIERDDYIIAVDGNKPHNIVGVLKWGTYGLSKPYKAITYVDVKKGHRRDGIATALIKTLDKQLTPEDSLVASKLSDEGKAANMHKVLRENITACPFFEDDTAFYLAQK